MRPTIAAAGAAAFGALLAGCAAQPVSYVAGVADGMDAVVLASEAADMVAAKAGPLDAPLVVAPVAAAQARNPVTPALLNVLRSRRYALADKPGNGARPVTYAVVPVEGFVVVRVAVDGWGMARALGRGQGGRLVPAAPLFVETPAEGDPRQ